MAKSAHFYASVEVSIATAFERFHKTMSIWKFVLSIQVSVALVAALSGHKTMVADLQELVNSPENKEIYSHLLFADNAFYDPEANVAGTLDFSPHHQFQRQPYVANGYIGSRIPNLGHGFAYDSTEDGSPSSVTLNGWPLFNDRYAGAFAAGFYNLQPNTTGTNFGWLDQYGWDSFIASIPQWTYLGLSRGNATLNPSESPESWGAITNYVQNMSFSEGIVATQYTWMKDLDVRYEVYANKHDYNLGFVKVTLQNPTSESITVNVTNSLDFSTAHRCDFLEAKSDSDVTSYIAFKPSGLDYVFGAIYSKLTFSDRNWSIASNEQTGSVETTAQVTVGPHSSVAISKIVGIVTSDLDPATLTSSAAVVALAKKMVLDSDLNTFEQKHRESWKETLGKSMNVKFTDEPLLTLAARASIFHLNANMRPGAKGLTAAQGVTGLSSDSYSGQVFWDTDLWISQGILPFNPQVSESLLQYRLYTHEQAVKNIGSPSKPNGSFEGAIYPWTSARFGNCTATGPCFDYEYHLNAAIAFSAFKLYLSGAVGEEYLEETIYPLVEDAAKMFASYVQYDSDLGQYLTNNLTDPDEFAVYVNNAAYTNSAISANMKWFTALAAHLKKDVADVFTDIMRNMHIPISPDSDQLILEYTGMNSSIDVKQADVIMITYPLDNQLISVEQAKTNIEYYAKKQISTGPAMTFSIFSIVSAAMLDTGCSCESYLWKSVQPFLRGPFAQFSEQNNDIFETNGGTHPAFPFLTAHGGLLQAILQGIFGMRYSYESQNGTISRFLEFEIANLALFSDGISFGGIHYMNHTLSLNLQNDVLSIQDEGAVEDVFSNEEIRIKVKQKDGSVVQRVLGQEAKVDFNISASRLTNVTSLTECGRSRFTNVTAGAVGDVPQSMHDGQSSTNWQSASNITAKILIDLKSSREVKSGYINWGEIPPRSLKISASSDLSEALFPQLNSTASVLSVVDFGPQIAAKYAHHNRNQDVVPPIDFFSEIYSTEVDISAPFSQAEYESLALSKRANITEFTLEEAAQCRFVLVEFGGVHEPSAGATVHEIELF